MAQGLQLKAMVEQELQQNPVLEELVVSETSQEEREERDGETSSSTLADPTEPPADVTYDPATEKDSKEPVDDFQAEFERLAQLDQEWRDHFSQTNIPMRQSQEEDEKRQFMLVSVVAGTFLQENLIEKVRLSELNDEQRQIDEMVIGNIDDFGYLQSSADELAFATSIASERIQEVVRIIQTFHPAGVGARDLRECLLLQLEREGRKDTLEYRIVDEYMEALGKRRIPEIARGLDVTVEEVQEALKRIANLEPRPGRAFAPDNNQYILPEVFVHKAGDDFVVSTNNDHVPHLRISNTYKDLMARSETLPEEREWIREKIRAGKFLIKSLHQRQNTIVNIAKEIV